MPCGSCNKSKKLLKKSGNIAKGFTQLAVDSIMQTNKYEFTDGRIRTCRECEKNYWIKKQIFCSICKCYIPAKARVEDEKCPLDKWKA